MSEKLGQGDLLEQREMVEGKVDAGRYEIQCEKHSYTPLDQALCSRDLVWAIGRCKECPYILIIYNKSSISLPTHQIKYTIRNH